ncbi:hypothetical protein G6F56_001324 [Rhizopus delemar]|uniref:C2H2-type domain-containing protein n=1 Tax=Rhizopus stolonifer TaxID=4846 RepID=A0A367KM69_RHIST|nr:hypothetical protein G6F56_001324 [Rhizopus delemar]RCI03277.1 hypothetical protein CU098_003619 [Rhizopus stolonifer]
MSSLTYQLQLQKVNSNSNKGENSLPSPPNSSCGDEMTKEEVFVSSFSLATHYSPHTANELSSSLPENYTIDHSTTSDSNKSPRNLRIHNRKDRRVIVSESPKSTLQIAGGYQCIDCGKIYKHPNCLTKHQWEHSEEWEYTSKFLLTKHQQVQMLEAATILMNLDKVNNQDEDDIISDNDDNDPQEDDESDIDIEMDDI